MNLFKLASEYREALDHLISIDDLPEEVILDTLEGLGGYFRRKCTQCC